MNKRSPTAQRVVQLLQERGFACMPNSTDTAVFMHRETAVNSEHTFSMNVHLLMSHHHEMHYSCNIGIFYSVYGRRSLIGVHRILVHDSGAESLIDMIDRSLEEELKKNGLYLQWLIAETE